MHYSLKSSNYGIVMFDFVVLLRHLVTMRNLSIPSNKNWHWVTPMGLGDSLRRLRPSSCAGKIFVEDAAEAWNRNIGTRHAPDSPSVEIMYKLLPKCWFKLQNFVIIGKRLCKIYRFACSIMGFTGRQIIAVAEVLFAVPDAFLIVRRCLLTNSR